MHEAVRSGALSAATTDPLEGALLRRPWDTTGREYIDETYHRLLHALAAEWRPEVDGDFTLDALVVQRLAEAFENSLHEFPSAAQLYAVLAAQTEIVGGVPRGRAPPPPGAPLRACEAHGAALGAFATVLRTQSARMEEKRRKQAEAYARSSGPCASHSAEELAQMDRLDAKTASLLDEIVAQELADGENASVIMELFADPAARRALKERLLRGAAKVEGAATKEDDAASAYMWQFEEKDDVWRPFEALVETAIESAFDAGKASCVYTRESGGAKYSVTELQCVRRDGGGTAKQERVSASTVRRIRRIVGEKALRARAREGGGASSGAGGETVAQRRRRVTGLKAAAALDTTIDITAVYGALHAARTKRLASGRSRSAGAAAGEGAWRGALRRFVRGGARAATKESGSEAGDAFKRGQNEDLDAAQQILAKTPDESASAAERAAYLNALRSAWRRARSLQTKAYERSKIAPFLLRYGASGGGGSGGRVGGAASKSDKRPPDLRTQRQGSSGRAGARPGGAGSSAKSIMARLARTKRIQKRLQVSVLLFTVTFYANLAHSLTCSPHIFASRARTFSSAASRVSMTRCRSCRRIA